MVNGKAEFYQPQLDGLRFLAALLVFIHHAPPLPYLHELKSYGWIGVDLFLAISAFLLTRLLCIEWRSTGSISLTHFFIRRSLRIWPLFFFYATALCGFALVQGTNDVQEVFTWWLSFVSFSNNILTAVSGYSPIPYTAHLWTIALEEQAYLVLPVFLVAYLSTGGSHKSLILGALAVIFVLILTRSTISLAQVAHPFIWVLPLRADPFILGAVLAILFEKRDAPNPFWPLCAGLALLFGATFFESVDKPGSYQIIGYSVVALGCTLIVLAMQSQSRLTRFLSLSGFRYLGKISFGIYIYHMLCIAIGSNLVIAAGIESGGWYNLTTWSVSLVLTIALSAASYRYFESSFLRLKTRYSTITSRPV